MEGLDRPPVILHRSKPLHYSRPLLISSQAQESRIRSRLLDRLGIHQWESQNRENAYAKSTEHGTNPAPTSFLQPLRDSDRHVLPATTYPRTYQKSKQSTGRTSMKTRVVRFNDNVLVVPIPSRHAYSDRIKKAFWRDGKEIQDIADRNLYEFTSEGWDWKMVLEEEDFYVDIATGEKIHPCWVEREDDKDEDEDERNHVALGIEAPVFSSAVGMVRGIGVL